MTDGKIREARNVTDPPTWGELQQHLSVREYRRLRSAVIDMRCLDQMRELTERQRDLVQRLHKLQPSQSAEDDKLWHELQDQFTQNQALLMDAALAARAEDR